MKITLSVSEIADRLRADKNSRWSYDGAIALAEYLEESTGEEMELDVVGIRCDFCEYESALEAADEKFSSAEEALEYLRETRATVLTLKNGGVVVSND